MLETVVHLEGPWQCFLAASLQQDSSSHCSQAPASGSFLLIHHLVQMMCSGLNGLGQAQLICNPADLAVRLLQCPVSAVSCLKPAEVLSLCVAAFLATGSDDGGTDAALCEEVIGGTTNTGTISLWLVL